MIYNNKVTGDDEDLNANIHNALIITEDFDDIYDPDDNAKGGLITFTFEKKPDYIKGMEIIDVDYVDVDDPGRGDSIITGTRADGSSIPKTDQARTRRKSPMGQAQTCHRCTRAESSICWLGSHFQFRLCVLQAHASKMPETFPIRQRVRVEVRRSASRRKASSD